MNRLFNFFSSLFKREEKKTIKTSSISLSTEEYENWLGI